MGYAPAWFLIFFWRWWSKIGGYGGCWVGLSDRGFLRRRVDERRSAIYVVPSREDSICFRLFLN